MCKVIEERFNSQLGIVGASRSLIDLQFGKGFSNSIGLGKSVSTDTFILLFNFKLPKLTVSPAALIATLPPLKLRLELEGE